MEPSLFFFIAIRKTVLTCHMQHAVKPTGDLRFALTCRYVKPEKVKPEFHYKGDYDEAAFEQYSGDTIRKDDAVEVSPKQEDTVAMACSDDVPIANAEAASAAEAPLDA